MAASFFPRASRLALPRATFVRRLHANESCFRRAGGICRPHDVSRPSVGGAPIGHHGHRRWASASAGTVSGTVKWWNANRGFGFISPDGGGEEVFCHHADITDGVALRDGAAVTFDVGPDERRGGGAQRASNVAGGVSRVEQRKLQKKQMTPFKHFWRTRFDGKKAELAASKKGKWWNGQAFVSQSWDVKTREVVEELFGVWDAMDEAAQAPYRAMVTRDDKEA